MKNAASFFLLIITLVIFFQQNAIAEEKVITKDGKVVMLNDDGTWEYQKENENGYEYDISEYNDDLDEDGNKFITIEFGNELKETTDPLVEW
ncbi:MAG: DUF3157 family protein [Candidatus Omnitrophica bacterium]|nr:DUF3157 family protein [Candidatus Omnitrophota bacterium]